MHMLDQISAEIPLLQMYCLDTTFVSMYCK